MGGKLSSEGEPSHEVRDSSMRPSHANRPETSNGTRLSLGNHQGLRFEPSVFSDNMNASVLDQRIMRANSVGMNGMAIPHPSGLRFYYNRTMLNSESNESEGRSSAPRSQYVVSQSLPPYLYSSMLIKDSQCPMCKKVIPADDVEIHFVMCVTKPRVTYNEDIMGSDSGEECAICLDELKEGENIARLPCLCLYHKGCIDEWFVRSQTCPEHPPD